MSESKNNFWQDHSDNYLKMAFGMDRCEAICKPDGYGKNTGDCGDTIEIFLTVKQDIIQQVAFQTNGCMNTHASANTVAHLTEGRPIARAWDITPQKVIEYLQTLPKESEHCAELAVGALYKALASYNEVSKNPWKKLYRS